MEKPKIRDLMAFPVKGEGEEISVVLTDPEGLSQDALQVSRETFMLLSLMDGKHTVLDIQAEIMRTSGNLIYSETIERLVKKLDECHFLDNENYRNWRKQIVDDFLALQSRPARHMGAAYPESAEEVRKMLDEVFASDKLPKEPYSPQPLALVAPHIDITRGAIAFASAYRTLKAAEPPATFFIFGTCHGSINEPFTLTSKDFETPLGVVKNAKEISGRLKQSVPWLTVDEFSHRQEHSIEFQVLFLRYLFNDADFSIVPILCRGFHEFMAEGERPQDSAKIGEFLEACREVLGEAENPILIAGADLAHIGPKFGHNVRMSQELIGWVREKDLQMLQVVAKMDADGFYDLIAEERDARRICGLPPIWALLKLLPEESRGVLLAYQQTYEPQTDSIVTFSAMAFHEIEDESDEDTTARGRGRQNNQTDAADSQE